MIEWLLAVFYYARNRISGDFFNTIGKYHVFKPMNIDDLIPGKYLFS